MARATVELGEGTIVFEGTEEFVSAQVAKLQAATGPGVQQPEATMLREGTAMTSEKAFVQEKRPDGASETIAVLAYYLREHGTTEFTDEDIKKAYIRAGVKYPKALAQAIRDAGRRFDYIDPGPGKGKYRLSSHGERTVLFDLPRKGAN